MTSITKKYTYSELRHAFLSYFKQQEHELVASSSLVPANDPTLLFTNAGMVQFKDVFLGIDKRPYVRAATAQRCVRAGGKHNDLDNVGYTARHHTFFEMLGNFSFGDYFKREAITFAWRFLTEVLQLPTERLWITVYEEDQEAADIWLNEINIDPQRFSRCGAKDNFWSMGETGPCGPCTEIFYDHGPHIAGGPPGSPDADGDRYVEIWNLVFMQFDRNEVGELKALPKPSVDTGMGLERLAAVMQSVTSNYDTDLFVNIIKAVARLTNSSDLTSASLRVIADHIRSASFLIADGVSPANEGRGYVLRRIIRRAIRHGNKLGMKEAFFHKLVPYLVNEMGDAYPELVQAQQHISRVLLQEEEQFAKTLEQGLKILEQDLAKLSSTVIPGKTVFRLYDTYGFPVDLTADIARERNLTIDTAGFEQEMAAQKRQSQEAGKFDSAYRGQLATQASTVFLGYEANSTSAVIAEIFHEGQPVVELQQGQTGIVVLEQSPFYAEAGGQIGDQGLLESPQAAFAVTDTKKQGNTILHYGHVVRGVIRQQQTITANINLERRHATARNHTATHLLHAALRNILGSHVLQKGSLVEAERLRFDFAHYEAVTLAQLDLIEKLVNQQIRANLPLETTLMSPEAALAKGAIGLFGEKYGSAVRVLRIADFSVELCGGTHVRQTGDIGFFKIISETGIAAGIRRIEAVTGSYADEWVAHLLSQMREAADVLKATTDTMTDKLKQFVERNRSLEKQVEQWQAKLASTIGNDLINQAKEINGIKVLAAELPHADAKTLRDTVDQLKQKLGRAVVVLGSATEGRVNLVAGVTKDCIELVKAGDIINQVAVQVGGKGGGRPDLAQAGGTNPEALPAALASCYSWVEALWAKSI